MSHVPELVSLGWRLYAAKVANGLLRPDNEKMMQLHIAQIFQTLAPLYEFSSTESYKVLLEVPVLLGERTKIIDVVLEHSSNGKITKTAIELKCFRLLGRSGNGRRGAQNLGMYDYWEDIASLEGCRALSDYNDAYQLTLTDDSYYVETKHCGSQVATYSTCRSRADVTGQLVHSVANRAGVIALAGTYEMSGWQKDGSFYFINQKVGT
jgi:hypothetical protein